MVIDEANLAMPNADPDAGASGVVQSLLRATPSHPAHCTREHMGDRMWQPFTGYRRANGVAILLGTQNPKDVNPVILNFVR